MQCTKSTQYALENENEKDKINNKNSRRTYAISSCVIIYPYILYRLQHRPFSYHWLFLWYRRYHPVKYHTIFYYKRSNVMPIDVHHQ